MNKSLLSRGNHAYFQLVGLRLICTSNAYLKACKGETKYGNRKINALIRSQFTKQGVHKENTTWV